MKPSASNPDVANRATEERFHQAFEDAPIGMAIVDFEYRLRRVNSALCRALDYPAAELLDQRFADITHADDIKRDVELANQLFRGEIPSYRIEKRFVKKDGSLAWLDVTALLIRDEKGAPLYGLAMVEDITNRKRVDEALRASEERYRSFVVNSSEGIWRLDVEQPIDIKLPVDEQIALFYKYGYLAEGNDAMARMHGYERADDIVGRRFGDPGFATHPANTGAMRKLIANNYRLLDLQTQQFDVKGGVRYYSNNFFGIILNGMLLRVWGVQRDETELRTTAIKLEHSHEQLRHLSGYLQNLHEKEKANIARELHDAIGQALASVKIQAALLKKHITASEHVDVAHAEQELDEISKSLNETMVLVKTISTELRPGVLDKFGLAAAIEWQCEETTRRTKMECRCSVPPADSSIAPQISTALFRILQEALMNAAKHSKATAVEVDLMVDGASTTLVIGDNGRGITPEEIKAPNSLGLLGMRERVEFLKGSFSVSGRPGRGTTIRASFNLGSDIHVTMESNREHSTDR